MRYVFPPPAVPSVAIAGTDTRFPVRRIWCVGRNYAAHAREMGMDAREPPFFFAKPADAVVPNDATIAYASATKNLHHEVELVVGIGQSGKNVLVSDALNLVYGYAVGFDLTRRDLQNEVKKDGRPWEVAKAFDHSAPCSALVPVSVIGHPQHAAITLTVDGNLRQSSDIAEMIWNVAETIAALSGYVELAPGDLIFTGTPEGVGPILPGQVLVGSIAGIGTLRCTIEAC